MQKLNVRFATKVNFQIDDIDKNTLDSVSPSMIARAAMQIGLNQLRESLNKDGANELTDKVKVQNLKALN